MVNKIHSDYECPVDIVLLEFIETHIEMYYRMGITPNMITTASIVAGVLSAYCIMLGRYWVAGILFMVAYYFDCADGKVARQFGQVTVFGDYYDHFGDLFKVVAVTAALYVTNSERFKMAAIVIILLSAGMGIHLGCQEMLHDRTPNPQIIVPDKTSSFLSINTWLVPSECNPQELIRFSRHLGCGTFNFAIALIIFFWRAKK